MRVVLQRVSRAAVRVHGEIVGESGAGMLALVGVSRADGPADAAWAARRIAEVRLFDGPHEKGFHLAVTEVGGAVLVVSQFTLCADVRKGRRPSFDQAAPPEQARVLYEAVIDGLRTRGVTVATGRFQAMMAVELVNDGPVTLVLDSPGGDATGTRLALDS
jgi:D-tyrosyl-tRNA(Tyr) deacylase